MLMTFEGRYRNGKIELTDLPGKQFDDTPVIVTFLTKQSQPVKTFALNEDEAAELRVRLTTFAEDWDNPAMDIYDDYDLVKASLSAR